MATIISENEDTETNKTKVSDSGYSNSCSNSQSQRSNSSKSRHSTSSGSSGYCGHPSSTVGSSGDEDHKKKKPKVQINSTAENVDEITTMDVPSHSTDDDIAAVKEVAPTCVDAALLDNLASPAIESEALQAAVLAQTLFCIKTNEPALEDYDCDQEMISSPQKMKEEPLNPELIISALKDEIKDENEFCIVVSLADGTVASTSASLYNVVGFKDDVWKGRSLIHFLHPKDRIAFANHITSAMARSKQRDTFTDACHKNSYSDYFYCWIRIYNGLNKSGFNTADIKTTYLSCQLSMNLKEAPNLGVFLVATARPVQSAYKVPSEVRSNPPTFTTRHTADTLISHVDNDVVSHFGYSPHDIIGRSIFDFYYDEDLPYLKDVYTNVLSEHGLLFMSRPYKFRCQNGDFVMVETEWSSFINPWGKKLEFIIGRHRVLTGPQNPDVVKPVLEPEVQITNEEEHTKSKAFQEEIKHLLTEPIVRCYEPGKKQLAQFVESLEKISSSQVPDQSTGMPVASATSEMLGEISPHHVYSDSKSSSETPPSYNQLTYNENIQRFFASDPKCLGSDESRDTKNELNQSSSSGGEEGKSLPNNSSFNSNSDILNGSGKSSGLSSNSARQDRLKQETSMKFKEKEVATIGDYKYNPKPLTEEMLSQHNEKMNKQMAQKHKKEKNKGQGIRKHKNIRHKNAQDNEDDDQGAHGTKRCGSHSWEGEPMKAFKGAHRDRSSMAPVQPPSPIVAPGLWSAPPFPVAITLPSPVQPITGHIPMSTPVQPLTGHMSYSSPLVNPIIQLPCVYMNTLTSVPAPPPVVCPYQDRGRTQRASEHPGPPPPELLRPSTQLPAPPTYQAQYMPSLMYQLPILPMVTTQTQILQSIKPRMAFTSSHQHSSSRATSVKGEPGSALCSMASTSLKQAMSESSKRENKSHSFPVYSPGGFTSNTEKTKTGTSDNDLTPDDSSYYSYSSFYIGLRADKSDDSMKGSHDKENIGEYQAWRKTGGNKNNSFIPKLRKEPSWMENVELTPDTVLRYQLKPPNILSEVLQSDLEALHKLRQSEMINEQLDQLYIDLEGVSNKLDLEESFPSCDSGDSDRKVKMSASATASFPSSSSSSVMQTKKKKDKRRKFMCHEKCSILFEQDAPMPSPSSKERMFKPHSSSESFIVAAQSS